MRYEVKAIRGMQESLTLMVEASDEAEAISRVTSQGYSILALTPRVGGVVSALRRGRRFPLALFSQELKTLLGAGLPLVEAMETLAEKEVRSDIKDVLRAVIGLLYEGLPLSRALDRYPEHFPPLYVATVRASETTGDLGNALVRYIAYHNQVDRVRKQLVSASIYPALVMLVGALVIMFLMGYVVPRFSQVYQELGRDLPFFARILMHWGRFFEQSGGAIGGGLLVGCIALVWWAMRPQSRQWIGHKLWAIPAVGSRMKLYQLARFYRTVGMLLRGGMPIMAALKLADGLLPLALRQDAQLARAAIGEGQAISLAMENQGLAPPVALRMLRVGERTGRMGEMMEEIATFYDDEMARWADRFSKLFEPLLMVAVGGIIGVIVVLMYVPIFELAGSIQ